MEAKPTEDITLKKEGNVFIMTMNKESNNFNYDFIRKIHSKLDIVEKSTGPACLITTSSSPKFFSTGLDLASLAKITSVDEVRNFLGEFQRLVGRMLCFPVPTIALINGHAFAGGCMLAFAHDFRIMRKDFGFICMNEVDLGFPLGPGMNAVVQCKIDPLTFRDMILLGKRYKPEEALARNMIDKTVDRADLLAEAMKLATQIADKGENRENFFNLKYEMYKEAYECCYNRGLGASFKAAEKMLPKAKLQKEKGTRKRKKKREKLKKK